MSALLINHYEVLGVGPGADAETIRRAYRRLARKHHPDVNTDPKAHENMARINVAFAVLGDPFRRGEYDALLAGGGMVDGPESVHSAPQQPIVVRLKHRLQGHQTPVYALDFDPESGVLVTSAFDNELLWWDHDQEKPFRRTRLDAGVVSTLRCLAGDRLVAAGCAENLLTLYRMDGALVERWQHAQEEWVCCLSVSPDGESVAAGSLHRTLTVHTTAKGELQLRRKEHDQGVTAVAWTADGKVLATGSADATVRVYDMTTCAYVLSFERVRSTVTALAFSQDGRFLAVAAVDLSIRVFNLRTRLIEKMVYGHTRPIESMAFHPNGWLLASGSRDGTVGLWNVAKGIGNVRIEVSTRPVSCVAFNALGTRLAAGGQDKLVRIWEVVAKEPSP